MRGEASVEQWLLHDLRDDARAAPHAIRLKLEKLGRDPFAFFRGTLPAYVRRVRAELRGPLAEPEGLILGDLHLENFGAYLAEDGQVAFDLNDFDEVTRAPLLIDLRRLAASATLVCGSDAGAHAVLQGFHHGCELSLDARLEHPGPVRKLLVESARARREAFIAAATVLDGRALRLKLGPTLHPTDPELAPRVAEALRDLRSRTPPHLRKPSDFYALHDAARRLAGNGSLGRRRYLALVGQGEGHPVLLDLKEPRPSPWGPVRHLLGVRERAAQVERAARALREKSEAILGTARLHGRLFQVREHSPHGMKLAAGALAPDELLAYARFTGAHLARSWRRAEQPVLELAGRLSGSGGRSLVVAAVGDAERTRDDHARFLARRDEIAAGLQLAA